MKNRLLAILAAGLLTASAVLAQSEENLWLYPPPKASLPARLKRFTRRVALNNIFLSFPLHFPQKVRIFADDITMLND